MESAKRHYARMTENQLKELRLHLEYQVGLINGTVQPKINRRTGKQTKPIPVTHMKKSWELALEMINQELMTRINLKFMEDQRR